MQVVTIYDGKQASDYVFKCDCLYKNIALERDLTSESTSSCEIYDENNIVVAGDFIYLPNAYGIEIMGIITSVDYEVTKKYKTVSFKFGADLYNNPLYLPNNSLAPNVNENNYSPLNVHVQSSTPITGTDNIIDLDIGIRQLMRSRAMIEASSKQNGVVITENNEEPFSFVVIDSDITNSDIKLANDTFNVLRLYNEDNLTQYQDYFLTIDGDVTTNPSDVLRPTIFAYETASAGDEENPSEWDNLGFATSKIKSQDYDNYINFDVLFDTNIKALKFDNSFLSRRVKVFVKEYEIDTLISGYKIENNLKINVTLGLTRSRLTKILKKEREV